jgi:hypothetical protein
MSPRPSINDVVVETVGMLGAAVDEDPDTDSGGPAGATSHETTKHAVATRSRCSKLDGDRFA